MQRVIVPRVAVIEPSSSLASEQRAFYSALPARCTLPLVSSNNRSKPLLDRNIGKKTRMDRLRCRRSEGRTRHGKNRPANPRRRQGPNQVA